MLPIWREKFLPDVVIANAENILHGKGIGPTQIQELYDAGVNIFTGGNHSVEGKEVEKVLNDEVIPVLRPANMDAKFPGRGVLEYKLKIKNEKSKIEKNVSLLVINLIGQAFMKPAKNEAGEHEYANPYLMADRILKEYGSISPHIILDFHGEATSEKSAMGWYLDGRVSLVYGTHTHVPSADAKILPKSTAFITDIGMTGAYHSVIGVEIEPTFRRFVYGEKTPKNPPEAGPIEVNAIFVELDNSGKAVDIKHLREIVPEGKI